MPVLNQENFDALHVRVDALEAIVLTPVDSVLAMAGSTFDSTVFATDVIDVPPPGPTPIDCVLTEWAIESASSWGACQPNGTQTRTETWKRTIVTAPEHGGTACGLLTEVRTGTRACVLPPDAAWPPVAPTAPPDGYKNGLGYPERRVWRESQWWEEVGGDIDNAKHFHIMTACPRAVTASIVRFDLTVRFFHAQGYTFTGIRKVVTRTNQFSQLWMPTYIEGGTQGRREVPITEHDIEFWTPAFIDLRSTTSGTYTFEFDAQATRPDGQVVQSRMIIKFGVGAATSAAGMTAEGWVSNNVVEDQFGYLSAETYGLREFESDPATGTVTIKPRAQIGRTVRLVVCQNPNFHAHPVNYGTILLDQTFVQPTSPPRYTIAQPAMVVGDRLFMRISDSEIFSIGAAAQVAVTKLCEG